MKEGERRHGEVSLLGVQSLDFLLFLLLSTASPSHHLHLSSICTLLYMVSLLNSTQSCQGHNKADS